MDDRAANQSQDSRSGQAIGQAADLIPRPWSSVLDALADAETLQSFLGDHGLGHMGTARPAVEAEASGKRAASWMTADRDGFLFTAEDLANRHGIDAARAAFRAVPGLR